VRLIWQPAEEHGDGAPKLMEEGVLEGVAAIFGGHLDPRWEPGVLVVTDGPVGASTDEFKLIVSGRQGHGGRPHEACDALLAGSAIVAALQSIVAREIDPSYSAVVTIGSFQAGFAPNVIADTATLAGTIRSLNPEVRAKLLSSVERVASGVARAYGASVRLEPLPGTPPVVNDPKMTTLAREAATAVVGAERVEKMVRANMGGEDFACYLERIPGCYIRFGGRAESGLAPAHSSKFDFDEQALAVGAAWMAEVARRTSASFCAD
jgi:hippurate hydrolase